MCYSFALVSRVNSWLSRVINQFVINSSTKKCYKSRNMLGLPEAELGVNKLPGTAVQLGSPTWVRKGGALATVEVPPLGRWQWFYSQRPLWDVSSSLRRLWLIQTFSSSIFPAFRAMFSNWPLQTPIPFRLPLDFSYTSIFEDPHWIHFYSFGFALTIISSHSWFPNPQPFLIHRLTRSYIKRHNIFLIIYSLL